MSGQPDHQTSHFETTNPGLPLVEPLHTICHTERGTIYLDMSGSGAPHPEFSPAERHNPSVQCLASAPPPSYEAAMGGPDGFHGRLNPQEQGQHFPQQLPSFSLEHSIGTCPKNTSHTGCCACCPHKSSQVHPQPQATPPMASPTRGFCLKFFAASCLLAFLTYAAFVLVQSYFDFIFD